MTYQIPRRNVTFTDELLVSKNGDRVTVRRCFEDDQPTATRIFVQGWLAREYRTRAGLEHFLKVHGCVAPSTAQREAWEQLKTP